MSTGFNPLNLYNQCQDLSTSLIPLELGGIVDILLSSLWLKWSTSLFFPSFNRIDIPPYEHYDKLYDKLLTAIEETCGFAVEWVTDASGGWATTSETMASNQMVSAPTGAYQCCKNHQIIWSDFHPSFIMENILQLLLNEDYLLTSWTFFCSTLSCLKFIKA